MGYLEVSRFERAVLSGSVLGMWATKGSGDEHGWSAADRRSGRVKGDVRRSGAPSSSVQEDARAPSLSRGRRSPPTSRTPVRAVLGSPRRPPRRAALEHLEDPADRERWGRG